MTIARAELLQGYFSDMTKKDLDDILVNGDHLTISEIQELIAIARILYSVLDRAEEKIRFWILIKDEQIEFRFMENDLSTHSWVRSVGRNWTYTSPDKKTRLEGDNIYLVLPPKIERDVYEIV